MSCDRPRFAWVALLVGVCACGDVANGGDRRGGGGPDLAVPSCEDGVDSDGDGLTDAEECTIGTDPKNGDSDADGVSDGRERGYPRACVANDPKAQPRPPMACMSDADCPGGVCRGLDPTRPDSDGDGVADGEEDLDLDGVIDARSGETDPRLADSDGDGVGDGMGGLDICRTAGLAQVTRVIVPGGVIQVGHDPAWSEVAEVTGEAGTGAVLLDAPVDLVAAAVFSLPSQGDVRMEAERIEAAIKQAIGAGVTAVLVGAPLTTHEMQPALTSIYRVVRTITASELRDLLVKPLIGVPAPGGRMTAMAGSFSIEISTVARDAGPAMGRTDVIVTIAPEYATLDAKRATAVRVSDLVNTTGVSENGKDVGGRCDVYRADRVPRADFVWTVDTSGSMGDDQTRLGNTASRFFKQLDTAGVDFRVAVLQAGSATLNVDAPGLSFISGADPMGATRLCEQVTSVALAKCPASPNDNVSPYPFAGGSEEPTAAAVIATDLLIRRGDAGEMNPNRRFRDGAQIVTFQVTDEPGSNDFSRYFGKTTDPQSGAAWGAAYDAQSLKNIVGYFARNQILTYGLLPRSNTPCAKLAVADLPRCVVEGNGGSVIPIATATQVEIDAAMAKIVFAVAGATSQFALTRSPITSTIQVKVAGKLVPRSRLSGFDYDPSRRSVIFFGPMYRPKIGDEVVVSFRVWQGSIG